MKNKRDRVVTDKRDIHLLDEDEVDFFQVFRRQFFGQQEDPWGVDEDLLAQIWEEIKLEGLFNSYNILLKQGFFNHLLYCSITELEKTEAEITQSLLRASPSNQIVCPVCLSSRACLLDGCVTCSTCDLKFPLPAHVTLDDFETALVASADVHHLSCSAVPRHLVHRNTDNGAIQFASSCESCQSFSIIFEHVMES